MKPEVHERIKHLVESGLTQSSIARELGITQPAVSQMIRRMVMRGQLTHEARVRDPRFVERVVTLAHEGMSVAQISLATGRNMSAIYHVLRELVQVGAIEGRGRGRSSLHDHDDAIDQLKELSRAGVTVTDICLVINRSQSWVIQHRARLRALGELPAKRHVNMGMPFDFNEKIREKIAAMIAAGHSTSGIAYAIGVSVETLKKYLKRSGMKTQRQTILSRYAGRRSI